MAESKQKTDWVKKKPAEIEEITVELAQKNTQPEKIGLILRDQHGIPKVRIYGKKMSQILKERDIEIDSNSLNNAKKIDKLKKHFEAHKHDYYAQRAIVKYTARTNKLRKQKKQ